MINKNNMMKKLNQLIFKKKMKYRVNIILDSVNLIKNQLLLNNMMQNITVLNRMMIIKIYIMINKII